MYRYIISLFLYHVNDYCRIEMKNLQNIHDAKINNYHVNSRLAGLRIGVVAVSDGLSLCLSEKCGQIIGIAAEG